MTEQLNPRGFLLECKRLLQLVDPAGYVSWPQAADLAVCFSDEDDPYPPYEIKFGRLVTAHVHKGRGYADIGISGIRDQNPKQAQQAGEALVRAADWVREFNRSMAAIPNVRERSYAVRTATYGMTADKILEWARE